MLATFPQRFVSRLGRTTTGISQEVPDKYPVAIDGRTFLLDEEENYSHRFSIESVQQNRQQSDTSDRPGEATINPEAPWRRSQESWHLGAGQSFQDRRTSSPYRFRVSKGIDIHTEWEMSLLNDTESFITSTHLNLDCFRVGEYIYFVNDTAITATLDPYATSPTYITPDISGAEADSTILSATNDGFNIYALVADGIHTIERGSAGSGTHLVNSPTPLNPFSLISYQKGRLIAVTDRELYEINPADPGLPTAPSPFFTHANPDFTFVAIAGAPGFVYAAGYSGDKTEIYSVTIDDTGTALAAPTIAVTLPDGEIVHSLTIYEDQVFIGIGGESTGVHLGRIAGDGSIITGAIIPTEFPVQAFEPQGRFVWFSMTDYDGESTGLGRMNLRYDTSDGSQVPIPAYASDLMYTDSGIVLSIASFDSKRIFAVEGVGFVRETDNRVTAGQLDSGSIAYDLSDLKLGVFVDTHHESPLDGSYSVSVKTDSEDFNLLGSRSSSSPDINSSFSVQQQRAALFEVRIDLRRDTTDNTLSPVIQRFTLQADPTTDTGWFINLPLLLGTRLNANNRELFGDPLDDFEFIADLRQTHRIVTLQFYDRNYTGQVHDFTYFIHSSSSPPNEISAPKGTLHVQFKTLTG